MITLATLGVELGAEEDDALLEQAGEDVVGPFASVGAFDDGGDEHGRLLGGQTQPIGCVW